jgi:hypothetical protein
MSQSYSYRNPVLSLWQAAVAEVRGRRESVQARMATVTTQRVAMRPLAAADDLMSPVHLIATAVANHPGGGPSGRCTHRLRKDCRRIPLGGDDWRQGEISDPGGRVKIRRV